MAHKECEADGCDRPTIARGLCTKHYQRLMNTGSLERGLNHHWSGDAIKYAGLHKRLRDLRGPASERTCVRCGGQAQEWSYDGSDPDEIVDAETGWTFSTDPDRYSPMCRACHREFDAPTECKRGHPRAGRGPCRDCRRARDREYKRQARARSRAAGEGTPE